MAKKQKIHRAPTSPQGQIPKPWEHAKAGAGSASDPLAARFVASLAYDKRLYRHDIAGSLAHAAMLRQVGLLSSRELRDIERGLKEIEAEINRQGEAWEGWNIDLEDVHMCIEVALIRKIGDPGRKLHTGRSRNDQVALDLKLWLASATQQLLEAHQDLLRAFLDLAQRDGQVVMPGYTHLQRAQPIVAGGEILAWMAALDRAAGRLIGLAVVNRANPLGAGAVAGSSLPLNRQATAEALHLGPPSDSAIDATASRDAAVDFVYSLAMTAMTLSRWAEQWILYASSEFGFIILDGKYTTGSSMMPQKRNPDMLELIRGRCGGVYGHLVALLTMLKGLPLGYNRDLQEDKRHVFAAYDLVLDCLAMATRIVATTRFNAPRITADLERGFLDATSLAEYLVTKGVPFRTAHQIVGSLVRTCELRGLDSLAQLALEDCNAACALAKQPKVVGRDVLDWLGPQNVVERYRTHGNAGLAGVAELLQQWQARLAVPAGPAATRPGARSAAGPKPARPARR